MKFSKEKMIRRLISEGREGMITREINSMMDNLDGCEASVSCWRRRVHEEPVLYVLGKDGTGHYVNENDCV